MYWYTCCTWAGSSVAPGVNKTISRTKSLFHTSDMPTPDHDSGDLLRPDRFLSSSSLRRSRSSWQTLLSSAQSAATLPYPCVNIKALLNKTPSIPQSPEAAECAWPNSLFIEGYSKWTISRSNNACHLPSTKQMLPRDVCIGDSQPGTCNLSEDYIPQWIGFQSPSRPVGNYLCVFVLGWSYILSARLIELRRTTTEDKVVYTDNNAQLNRHDEGDHFDLDIGSDDAAEVGWWAAILADGCGWQATLARDGKVYYPPWECHLSGSPFRLCHHAEMPSSISSLEPVSSAKAQEYLFNLARFYDAFDEVISALAAAITLPEHNRFGAPITLPQATRGRNESRQNTERIYANEIPTSAEIPHFMAFSATSGLVATCLFGCFWEPGIPCNLVSQWLNPPMREIFPPFIQAKESYTVVGAMSQRRPNVAALWLGSAITGLLPRIFQFPVNRSMLPTTCLEAATWTASPHSFMDSRYYHPAPVERIDGLNVIPREDEFRLMFVTDVLSQTFRNPPLSPYPPFGHVAIENTSLDVRLHLSCNHRPVYHSWNWKCRNGQVLSDFGIPCRPNAETPEPKATLRQSIWMMARITCTRLHKRWVGVCTRLQKVSLPVGNMTLAKPDCIAACIHETLLHVLVAEGGILNSLFNCLSEGATAR